MLWGYVHTMRRGKNSPQAGAGFMKYLVYPASTPSNFILYPPPGYEPIHIAIQCRINIIQRIAV